MAKVSIALPEPRVNPSHVDRETVEISYELVRAEVLPRISSAHTVGRHLLGERGFKRHISFMRRHASTWILLYFVGISYRMYAMVVPARYSGYWWLALSFLMQFPSVSFVSLGLRYEFVWQLMKSFEFWFFLAVNVVWIVTLFIGYQDSRIVVCFMSLVELENATMSDANAQRLQFITPAALISCLTSAICAMGVLIDAIEIHNPIVWKSPRGHCLRLKDLLVNTMMTITLFMARLAYRKRYAWHHADISYIQCVACRCRLKFAQRSTLSNLQVLPPPSSIIGAELPTRPVVPPMISTFQLECTPVTTRFAAGRVLGRYKSPPRTQVKWIRRTWALLCVCALVAAVCLAVIAPPGAKSTPCIDKIAMLAIGLTVCAASPFIALHQIQLLGRLFTSFDFVFLLLQNVSTGISVCYLAHWQFEQCVVVACITIWFYVMITYDALTPVAKKALGWSPIRATALAGFLLVTYVILGVQLLCEGSWSLADRVLIDFSVHRRRMQVFVIPFTISRLSIVVIWNCRLVWRLVACSRRPGGEMELITLLGPVQYKRQRSSTIR